MTQLDPAPRRHRCGARALWAHATAAQRAGTVGGAVLLAVGLALVALDPAALPVALAVLFVDLVLLARLRVVLLRCRQQDLGVRDEAARGQVELERWLASGEHA